MPLRADEEQSEEVRDEMTKRADDLLRRINELEERIVREEGRRPIVSPVPDLPTEQEVLEHNVTHTHTRNCRAPIA